MDSSRGFGVVTTPNEEISHLLDVYTNYHARALRRRGVVPDLDEIRGELGLAYAEAMDAYTALPESQRNCSSRTYVIKAFAMRMKRYGASCVDDRNMLVYASPVDEEFNWGAAPDDISRDVEEADTVKKILAYFSGLELLIVKELLCPSAKIQAFMDAYAARQNARSHYDAKATQHIPMYRAFEYAYGITRMRFRHAFDKIKLKLPELVADGVIPDHLYSQFVSAGD